MLLKDVEKSSGSFAQSPPKLTKRVTSVSLHPFDDDAKEMGDLSFKIKHGDRKNNFTNEKLKIVTFATISSLNQKVSKHEA